jgi:hypothetical protein
MLAAGLHPNLNGDNRSGVIGLNEQHETVFKFGAVNGLGPEAFEKAAVGGSEQ